MTELYLATILGGAGIGILSSCISSLTSSANGIYTLIGNINNNEFIPDISDFLAESDIQHTIKSSELLVREIKVGKHSPITLIESLDSLKDCMLKIEDQLSEVKKRLTYNKSLWIFVYYRSYKFTDIVKKLRTLKMTLDIRRDSLFDILKINSYLTPLSESQYLNIINTKESILFNVDSNKK